MTPDRWHAITEVFHGALARDLMARDAFVEDACKDDPSLRAEVEALLAGDEAAGSFGDVPSLRPRHIWYLAPPLDPIGSMR